MPKSVEQKRREATERQMAYDLKHAPQEESPAVRDARMSEQARVRLQAALAEPLSTPYLIQRAAINKPYMDMSITKVGSTMELDYMGSSEFENGSTGISLRVLQARSTLVRVTAHPTIVDEQKRPLLLLHAFDSTDLISYNEFLLRLRGTGASIRTKERTNFELINANATTDLWWDLRNHVLWSFDQHFMMNLRKSLEVSWTTMNEEASAA